MQIASSPTAASFGADVSAMASGRGMCMIVARRSPIAAVNSVDGQLVALLPGNRAIAIVDIRNLAALQAHEDVRLAGPISIDPARFAAFQRLVGVMS